MLDRPLLGRLPPHTDRTDVHSRIANPERLIVNGRLGPRCCAPHDSAASLERAEASPRAGGYMQKLRGLEHYDSMPLASPNDARLARP